MHIHLREQLQEKKAFIERALDYYLPPEEQFPESIHRAMRYSLFAGGKRIRPLLILLVMELFGQDWKKALPVACAMELIHTYSLIHDDLPAMDDDDYRRGRLTSHKVFGEAVAILAGDALLTLAFEVLSSSEDSEFSRLWNTVEPAIKLRVIAEIASAAGTRGMIGGQVVDLESTGKHIGLDTIRYVNTHKTGALLKTSVRLGVLIAGCSRTDLERMTSYAEALGEAFQLVDDLLDVEGDEEKTGKESGMDLRRQKSNYVSLIGLEPAKARRDELYAAALTMLDYYGESARDLREMTRFVLYRNC
ncbi:MAG: polyprenyl synthetase family protein [Dethiobacteria bacterium]|jgi:geranylgeranyl diphosphate synthase type II